MHKFLLLNNYFFLRILQISLILFLISNCTTTENATRLEKWSWMIQEEDKIFESSISEFGKLKPLIERNKFGQDIETAQEEYILIQNSTEQFAEDICKNISDWNISSSKDWVERIKRYISTKNVNVETLEKSFNYKLPNEARGDCNSVSSKNQFILDDILKLVTKIKADLDDPQKENRKARLDTLLNRITGTNKEKAELQSKSEIVTKRMNSFREEVYELTDLEFNITERTFLASFLLIQLKGITNYPTNFLSGMIAVIGLGAILNREFSKTIEDRKVAGRFTLELNSRFYSRALQENENLLRTTQYNLINDKENKLPGFDEFAAALDFQISNYEELHQYFLTKDRIQFKTKEIQTICEKHKCNRKPDMDLLKKNAKITIEELKKRKMASSLLIN
jgi:hypothetical protein